MRLSALPFYKEGPSEPSCRGRLQTTSSRRGVKAIVVSVEEKAHKMCQVWIKKMSGSKSRMTCRKKNDGIKTRVDSRLWDKLGGYLFTVRVVSGIHVA